jgi:hypothetical protein
MVGKSNNIVTFPVAANHRTHSDSTDMKARLIIISAVVSSCALGSMAVAADPHTPGTKGQPSQSCSVTMVTPGNAVNARGSAFNPNGVSGAVYANPPPAQGGVSSGNSHVVAQYDVACFQQTMRELQQSARMTERATRMSIGHGRGGR